jgi:hypothetical protein
VAVDVTAGVASTVGLMGATGHGRTGKLGVARELERTAEVSQ